MSAPTLTFNGRLPGVDCQSALPEAPTTIRLDVAGFVGFAERGPLDQPVAVEDINQFRAVFGGDLALASDGLAPVYANLPGAVQSFFDNGGRRCYVVRVAGAGATAARWILPGIGMSEADGTVSDVYVQAAWPGRWSKGLSVGTQLARQPLSVAGGYKRRKPSPPTLGELVLTPASCLGLAAGDLISLDLGALYPSLYLRVASVDIITATVKVDAEIPYLTGISSPPSDAVTADNELLLGPEALDALPASVGVSGGWLLRMDVMIGQVLADPSEVVERIGDLRFNPGSSGYWLDALQAADDQSPDQSRTMLLRADPATIAPGGNAVFVPAGINQQGCPSEFLEDVSGMSTTAGEHDGSDDLVSFDPVALFLDGQLAGDTVDSLVAHADALTVFSHYPARLHGIHALLQVDEVALISTPDAVHLRWSAPVPPPPQGPVTPVEPPPPPDFSHFIDCAPAASPVPTSPPTMQPTSPPTMQPTSPPTEQAPNLPILDDPAGYNGDALLQVQSDLIRMCAARADQLAVLSVPRHFDSTATLGWLQQLADGSRSSDSGVTVSDPLSFASFWHPWVSLVEPITPQLAPLRDQPADGVVCGTIAARELARGVWLAPANVALRGPVALAPALSANDTVNLFNSHVNLLRQRPGTFSATSAHTLATDPALLQISVRRLLIMLRKIALVEGSRYVFDVNNDRFRQLVRMRFERILAALTGLGALAAYQVITEGGVNTAQDIDNGRFIVQLQVAPTSPIEFITITLVRAGEGLLDVVVG